MKYLGDLGRQLRLVAEVHLLEKVEHSIEVTQLPQQLGTLAHSAVSVEGLPERHGRVVLHDRPNILMSDLR